MNVIRFLLIFFFLLIYEIFTKHFLTINMQVLLYDSGRMSGYLAFICALIVLCCRFDFQSPIARVLKFDFVAGITAVNILADCQQIEISIAVSSTHPRYLQKLKNIYIYNNRYNTIGWRWRIVLLSDALVGFKLVVHLFCYFWDTQLLRFD